MGVRTTPIEIGKAGCCFSARAVAPCAGDCGGQDVPCRPWRALGCADFIRCLEGWEGEFRRADLSVRVPAWKRFLDLACILLALPAWAPLMALIALFVKCVSPGPVFFRQVRVGLGGRRFDCLKFRTMKVGAESAVHREHLRQLISADHPMTKLDLLGDSRLIRGGKFLRSSGLDELPQVLNVLRGEMSLVGPRPCTPFECGQYEDWHRQRFSVLPGLTGLWQVSGKNSTTFRQMILLDLYYANNAGPWMDCQIMWRTLGVLAAQMGETRHGGGARATTYTASLKKKQVRVA